MADEKKEAWVNYLALSTVFFAVCATLATFKGGGYSTQSIMNQSKASDNWAYYQAKNIKEDLYKLQSEKLEMDKIGKDQKTVDLYQNKINDYKSKIEKYENEKKEIKSAAEGFETTRDQTQAHAKNFGMAVIFLQITILLSTIAGLLKKKYIWYIGLGSGLIGIGYFINGFLLFV
ncbi:MAG: DUF4337 domain-containing protein [Sulfuricurvum sp.]|nr:DUF4337 domain-containing protein [Sulfuricurvum sp.]